MSPSHVAFGVCGGIAAYKSAMAVSRLVQQDWRVTVVMTATARRFLGPSTMSALAGAAVVDSMFDDNRFPLGAHIELAEQCDVLCVAPATANFLAKSVQGIADDLLSTLYLAFCGPVILAPAMNQAMWRHAAVQRNVAVLRDDGVQMVGPTEGWLSCRVTGPGRMAEADDIVAAVNASRTV